MGTIEIQACELLRHGEAITLATVLKSGGSTPRTAGARMIVREDRSILGTIGGGKVEAEAMSEAHRLFETRDAVIRQFDLSENNTAASIDMICGGRMTVLMEYIEATPENIKVFQHFSSEPENRKQTFVMAMIGGTIEERLPLLKRIIVDTTSEKTAHVSAEMVHRFSEHIRRNRRCELISEKDEWFLIEPVFVPGTVFLFGGGHVSLQVARLAQMTGFMTVVLDDRPEFANTQRFPEADAVHVLDHFEHAFNHLSIDPDSYVVIVTRGHFHDKTVLAQALQTPAGYIGMIGSRRKRDMIYESLLREGFSEADIKRVYSPIGIHIHAETPEEIAVSIVGELILVRNGKNKSCNILQPLY